jgi:DNA adenine methylase
MGTGVVGFNVAPEHALFSDLNPHTILFYRSLQTNETTPCIVRHFLEESGARLAEQGESYFYEVRTRFNKYHRPLDFLFLSRACFNGMIRFNRQGEFNVPFCRKPGRFSKSYITKIVNQVSWVHRLVRNRDWVFESGDFASIIASAGPADCIYCDPPYFQRHVDYYNCWGEGEEYKLYMALKESEARFLLSTWQGNEYRNNNSVENYWKKFSIHTRDHFYHVGAKENNRHAMTEALVFNYQLETERRDRERLVRD